MLDKDWLDRVKTAAGVYEEIYRHQTAAVETFVKWLYEAYGIVPPEERVTKGKEND